MPPCTRPVREPTADFSDREHGVAIRHILEKIAATHRRLAFEVASSGAIKKIVATGGGARSPLWLQIKADMLGVPVVRSSSAERACLGAATIAAAASGHFSTLDEAAIAMVHPGDAFEPNPSITALYRAQ